MNLSHLPLLALDPSKSMGHALWHPEERRVYYGAWHIDGKGHGEYYDRFLTLLEAFLAGRGLDKDLRLRLAIEAPAPNAERSQASLQLSEGWAAVLKLWAFRRGLAEPYIVAINSWRPYFIDYSKRPKTLQKGDVSKWLKEQVMLKCNALGFHPKSYDASDAIGILKFVKDGGMAGVEMRRSAHKQEIANRRAQKKLEFAAA